MFSDFREPDEIRKASLSNPEREGILQIEVPHWAAQIQITDHDFKPQESVGIIKSDPTSPSGFMSETILPAGNYQVQMSLDGKSAGDWCMVRPGHITRVSQENWTELKLTSAAPLEETDTRREWHTYPAEEWSRKITWKKYSDSNSRLFVFVRTLEPQKYKKFFEGLFLLSADGEEITDFSQGVEFNSQAGWLAFNADLPEGGYILSLKRRDAEPRFQPIFLCRYWETQIFLIAERFPLLSKMSVTMARKGTGFRHQQESSVAAEAVFKSLQSNSSYRQLAMSEQMRSLLRGKIENPWFGILAAYALRLALEEAPSESNRSRNQDKFSEKLKMAINFLRAEIPSHPDVRALLLQNDKAASSSFIFPPMIWLGLKIVQKHATEFINTIEHGSLTYHVLENLYADSPWTGWRKLERMPQFGRIKSGVLPSVPPAPRAKSGQIRRRSSSNSRFSITDAFSQTAQTGTPIYDISSLEADPVPPAETAIAIENTALIQVLDDLIKTGGLDLLPETVFFNPSKTFNEILQISAREISTASGLPLSSVEYGLGKLREGEKSGFSKISRQTATSRSAQTVLEFALRENDRKKRRPDPETVSFSKESTKFSNAPITLEELASKIRVESERLNSSQDYPDGNMAIRLNAVADTLLSGADSIVLTSQSGDILYFNSAFAHLLSRHTDVDKNKPEELRRVAQTYWQTALKKASLGTSDFANPQKDRFVWKLKRIAIKDEATGESRAFLNVLKRKDGKEFSPQIVSEINDVTRKLSNRILFFIYGKRGKGRESFNDIENLTKELERLVDR